MSFAIPIDVAQRVEEQILRMGQVRHARLGVAVQGVNQNLAKAFKLDKPAGALIGDVEKGSAADRAGLHSGDVVMAVNGQAIDLSGDLPAIVGLSMPGDVLAIDVWRQGARHTLQARLDDAKQPPTRKANAGEGNNTPNSNPSGPLGPALRLLNPEEKRQSGLTNGLLIEGVSGAAAHAGVQPSDLLLAINGEPVRGLAQAGAAARGTGPSAAILVQRGMLKLYVPLRLG